MVNIRKATRGSGSSNGSSGGVPEKVAGPVRDGKGEGERGSLQGSGKPYPPKRKFTAEIVEQRIVCGSLESGEELRVFLAQHEADVMAFEQDVGWVYMRRRAMAKKEEEKDGKGSDGNGNDSRGGKKKKKGNRSGGGNENTQT